MPTRHKFTILKQVVEKIPGYLVSKLAREHNVDQKSRTFSPWSHVVSMVYAQLSHALSLNDVCDGLRNHAAPLSTLRGATAPSRNGLSHANRTRNSDMDSASNLCASPVHRIPEQVGREFCPSFHDNSGCIMEQV